MTNKPNDATSAAALFDTLQGEDLAAAEERFRRYVDLALRVYERLESDPEAYARFRTLTDSVYRPTIRDERSKPTETPING